jgi:hypothetical protein
MSRIKPALRRALFLLRGGKRLDGCEDEQAARGFHLLLSAFLGWFAIMELLIVPLFAARKAAGAVLLLIAGGVALAALILLRRSRKRPAAALFLECLVVPDRHPFPL